MKMKTHNTRYVVGTRAWLPTLLSLASIMPALAEPASTLAPLPERVTSFGAVTAGGSLYVFGGHKGERHDYNVEMVSGSFHRLNLSEGKTWEKLPDGPAGQGLPLVAHGNYIYRVGGMAARNHQGEKQDLFSMTNVQRYDLQKGQWEDFTALPAPRSSHDAV